MRVSREASGHRPLIAVILGYGASALKELSKALSSEAERLGFSFLVTSVDNSLKHLNELRKARVILVYGHELPHEVEELLRHSTCPVISISEALGSLSNASPEVVFKAALFMKLGGEDNLKGLVLLLAREAGFQVDVPEPVEVPWHGIYHPKLGLFEDVEAYLKSYYNSDKPLVALLYHRTLWLYKLIRPVELLIEKLEALDLGVIPIFTCNYRDPALGVERREEVLKLFLIRDGKPIVDLILDLTFFSPLGRFKGDLESTDELEILRKLDVPLISLVTSFYKTVEEWLEDPRGVDFLSQVYRVVMPEIDGGVEPIPLLFSRVEDDGSKRYEEYKEHVEYVAKRVKRWIELRRKPPHERRIAIILINPPCKGLEASVGVGMGLNVPESVVKLLHKLKEHGYQVGDWIPQSGDELVKFILDRKAISEFRWTPIEDVVSRGGAVGFVGLDEYLEWFMELPEETRKRMVEVWGRPEDVLSGSCSRELAGMVYEGRFVVPGVLFGNVLVMCQPKFGCAGPACDGRVCKILHDPLTPPPHQWLAAYRWVTRVFRADVLIHFGTHGYLEFRPGKGVGLSPSCWPEITVDDTPHVYVYNVSNPMEGVIAKRRGYAVIVDHLYPPMSNAQVLDEVEELLAQYSKAKGLGDYERAKIVFEELLDKAKQSNIQVSSQDPERAVEEIHRYVTAVRSSQIELGLHVFGHPPRDPEVLSNYVVTLMTYDTHAYPSIIRVLAEALGLDYDEMRKAPLTYNAKLGLTNQQIIDKLREVSKRVLERLLRSKSPPSDDAIINLLSEEVAACLGVKLFS
ncbi:MAG: hypothetical protein DRJ68_00965 [Thermoprotei archaeon]|nr:MAG: hypothetical protein DRJ68_00965 [Thermoprotei archaeon]